jgi:hypothetical protein
MTSGVGSLPRDVLTRALGGDIRAVRAFEQEAAINANTADRLASNVDATDALNDATVLVLSSNAAFNNERVLKLGAGISARDDGASLTIYADDDLPHVQGGFPVNLTATQKTNLLLPNSGRLATTDQVETLVGKTVDKPILSGLGNYASDAAASAGGVPINGIYHNAGILRVRLA